MFTGERTIHTIIKMHCRIAAMRNSALCLVPIVVAALPLCKRACDGSKDGDEGISCPAALDQNPAQCGDKLGQDRVERR